MTRRIGLVTAVVAVVILGAFWFLFWKPSGKALAAARSQQASVEAQASTLQTQVMALRHERQLLPHDRAELAQLRQAVPGSVSLASALDQLSGAASASGVTLPSVTPAAASTATPGTTTTGTSGKAAPKGPQSVTLTLSAQGSYRGLMGFVDRLRSTSRLFVVDSFTASAGGSSPAGGASAGAPAAAPAAPATSGNGQSITAQLSVRMFYTSTTPAAS